MSLSQTQRQQIRLFLDRADIVSEAFCLGQRFAELSDRSDQSFGRSQINDLFSMTCGARSFFEIEAFVKRKVALERIPAEIGLEAIRQLREIADFGASLSDEAAEVQSLRLELARGWAQLLCSEFLFSSSGARTVMEEGASE